MTVLSRRSLNTIAECGLGGSEASEWGPEGFVDKGFRRVGFHGQRQAVLVRARVRLAHS